MKFPVIAWGESRDRLHSLKFLKNTKFIDFKMEEENLKWNKKSKSTICII